VLLVLLRPAHPPESLWAGLSRKPCQPYRVPTSITDVELFFEMKLEETPRIRLLRATCKRKIELKYIYGRTLSRKIQFFLTLLLVLSQYTESSK